jgi:hypothetical protein
VGNPFSAKGNRFLFPVRLGKSDYKALWAAMLCCFTAICWIFGAIKILFTKDLVVVASLVVNLTYVGSAADIRICGRKDLWWLPGWCFIQ